MRMQRGDRRFLLGRPYSPPPRSTGAPSESWKEAAYQRFLSYDRSSSVLKQRRSKTTRQDIRGKANGSLVPRVKCSSSAVRAR